MIKLSSLLPSACYGSIGTIIDRSSIDKLEQFLGYNIPFIQSFNRVVIALNKAEGVSDDLVSAYLETWSRNVPNAVLLVSDTNRGHMFGTIDLEGDLLKYVKANMPEVTYLFKAMDDVVTYDRLLDCEVPEADFYYMPGFSYETVRVNAKSVDDLKERYEDFRSGFYTPQTTFFILNISKVDSLYGDDVEWKYNHYLEVKKVRPTIKPWEIKFYLKFDCESHLGRTTKDFSKYCLIEPEFKQLATMADTLPIPDPSHKNIFFNRLGLCHYHYYKDNVIAI